MSHEQSTLVQLVNLSAAALYIGLSAIILRQQKQMIVLIEVDRSFHIFQSRRAGCLTLTIYIGRV